MYINGVLLLPRMFQISKLLQPHKENQLSDQNMMALLS